MLAMVSTCIRDHYAPDSDTRVASNLQGGDATNGQVGMTLRHHLIDQSKHLQ